MDIIKCSFSGVYAQENFLDGIILDFTGLEGTSCYCSDSAAEAIRTALAPYGPDGIHWIDSGDYHYVSLFLQELINEPYSLALFDNHPDDQRTAFGEDVLSCGSWVSDVRRLPMYREDAPAVYVSIDKDVLSREFARTDWNQGTMTLEELFEAIRQLSRTRRIIGFDICGELSEAKGASAEDLRVNRETNLKIQDFLLTLKSATNTIDYTDGKPDNP